MCAAARSTTPRPACCRRRSWRDAADAAQWTGALDRARPVVVACKAGHELSQMAAAELRARGFDARVLAGGYEAWSEAGLPLVDQGGARALRAEARRACG